PPRCQLINPTTGKTCNIEFSRPYDLLRHENLIHSVTRPKVRVEEKCFLGRIH
ncbi:hypothetical protein DM02DRAFT_529969, partial [Periconia macrospinosa]